MRSVINRLMQQEDLNFLLTNRIPRRLATRFLGWFAHIEQPLVRDLSIAIWRFFAEVDLSDAEKKQFASVHDCFTRALRDGARPIDFDPNTLVSPCDAIVGACGVIAGTELLQVKGRPYGLQDLFGDSDLVSVYQGGCYATLRLTAGTYHRFHAPHDCRLEAVAYHPGELWNVNPVALRRIDKLFCRNERAVLRMRLTAGLHVITLVPVAAILVAGIRLHCLGRVLDSRERQPAAFACDATFRKGEEMGWFQHGSTILVFAPNRFSLCPGVEAGTLIRMGQPLMWLPKTAPISDELYRNGSSQFGADFRGG
jgi:phosphatidylserine decarboxylase